MASKWGFSNVAENSQSELFWFLHEVTVVQQLKINLNDFLDGKFCLKVFGPNQTRNGPNMKFFKLNEKSMNEIFDLHEVTVL